MRPSLQRVTRVRCPAAHLAARACCPGGQAANFPCSPPPYLLLCPLSACLLSHPANHRGVPWHHVAPRHVAAKNQKNTTPKGFEHGLFRDRCFQRLRNDRYVPGAWPSLVKGKRWILLHQGRSVTFLSGLSSMNPSVPRTRHHFAAMQNSSCTTDSLAACV